MKQLLICALASLFIAAMTLPAPAEGLNGQADLGASDARPMVTQEPQIAMMYWQLARKTPDFAAMARATDEYKQAGQFEHDQVEAGQIANLKGMYDSVNFAMPMVVQMAVHLSRYSEKNKGFVITDFEDQTYFKYSFAGENYAVVPRGLMDHQFMGPIDDPAYVKAIEDAGRHFGQFRLMIYLKPDYADPPTTLTEIDGKRYHIISGAVSHVSLFNLPETQQLWGDNSQEFNKEEQNQLLNLKQN